MLKVRITYADKKELDLAIKKLEQIFNILSVSEPYRGRGRSQYSNVYLDIENTDNPYLENKRFKEGCKVF